MMITSTLGFTCPPIAVADKDLFIPNKGLYPELFYDLKTHKKNLIAIWFHNYLTMRSV